MTSLTQVNVPDVGRGGRQRGGIAFRLVLGGRGWESGGGGGGGRGGVKGRLMVVLDDVLVQQLLDLFPACLDAFLKRIAITLCPRLPQIQTEEQRSNREIIVSQNTIQCKV